MTDDLLNELLEKPVGPQIAPRALDPAKDFTREIEKTGDSITATIRGEEGTVNDGTALSYLEEEGLDPSEWEATGFRKTKYGNVEDPMESVQFTFRRAGAKFFDHAAAIDELLDEIRDYAPVEARPSGPHGFLVLMGDMQFGKIDGDGVKGTVARTVKAINDAADRLLAYRRIFDIGHVHIAWLGDHIEGFVSQGGANAWRTQLPLNEQIRLTRRVMLHALKTFAPLAEKVTMAAVPGNHGEPVRFEGTGLTRYDDSHDTEALIAVSDAAELVPEAFGHVGFYVPDTDELIVMTEVAGTNIAHHHGHKWKPGKHFEWWANQAFDQRSPMHMADVLVAGHLHHEEYDTWGHRGYWGLNALESESTWFRHARGVGGSPAANVGVVKDGRVIVRETIHLT